MKYSSEHNEISLNEIREFLTQHFSLTDEEKAERVPSGTQTKFDNRIYWTKSYFSKAKLIENTKRSHFKITDRGRNFLKNFSSSISISDLKTIGEFREFNEGVISTDEQKNTTTTENVSTIETKTPLERLEESYQFIKRELASELLDKIRANTWQFFEDLVIDLMVKMGYGGSRNKAGESIKRTNDEGIDGIINEDKLGLDVIYLQAKMWKEETSIGRPEIQKFVGALAGKQAQKGLFITTTKFSNEAIDYARNLLGQKVVLVDGNNLARLMIKHNLGVSVEHVYEVKRVDSDFFADEL